MKEWFAIYTNPRAEKAVNILLQKKGIEVFLPIRKVLKQWKDRKKWVEEVLFNSYIFVNITKSEYLDVLKTHGVVKFIIFEGKPVSIPENQIEIIRKLINNEFIFEVEDSILSKGDKVEVTNGVMKGLKGILVNFKGKNNVAVVLNELNKTIIIDIDKRLLKTYKE